VTRREFDALTKYNASPDQPRRGGGLASDERWQYRTSRMRAHNGCPAFGPNRFAHGRDELAERAAWRRKNPGLAVFDLGSTWRGRVSWRLLGRLPALPMTPQERAAFDGRKYCEFTGR
jgi:hypothetical protein